MFRKSMLITAMCVSSVSLTGCSTTMTTAWNSLGDLVNGVSEVTKSAFLRGSSKKSDVSFAENVTPADDGTFKTEVGEYIPVESQAVGVEIYSDSETVVDTSPVPCPDGTYLAEDKTCMSLETDTYDFPDLTTSTQVVDTSPVPCPEGTFLNAENACMSLDTDEYDFASELPQQAEQVIDTSPVPCPEGTFLNAENACMYLETESFEFSSNLETVNPSTDIITVPSESAIKPQDFAVNPAVQCPEGFILNADNSCQFLGNSVDSGN